MADNGKALAVHMTSTNASSGHAISYTWRRAADNSTMRMTCRAKASHVARIADA